MKQRKQKFDHSYRQASGGKHGFPRCLGIRYLQSFVFKSVPEQQALTLIRLTQDAVCSRQCFKYKGEKEQKQKVEETTLHILWSRSPSKSWQFLSVRCPPPKKMLHKKMQQEVSRWLLWGKAYIIKDDRICQYTVLPADIASSEEVYLTVTEHIFAHYKHS